MERAALGDRISVASGAKKVDRRLLLAINSLRTGGAEKVCVTLANGLALAGYEVEIVVLKAYANDLRHRLKDGITVMSLDCGHTRTSLWRMYRYLRKAKPQLILSFNRQISVLLSLLRVVGGLQFALISRSIIFLSLAEREKRGVWHGRLAKYFIRRFYPLSDCFIAQSTAMAEDLHEYLNIPRNRITTIPNPLSEDIEAYRMSNCRTQPSLGNFLLCIGRVEKQKNFGLAIRVFSRLIDSVEEDLRLKIVGDGSMLVELRECAATLGVGDRVDFEGFRFDVIRYIAAARATLLTSYYEGFPNVLTESIALGTPVVAFDCPSGPADIVKSGVNGFLVRHMDEEQYEESLKLCLGQSWDREKIIETANAFKSAAIVARYERVLSTWLRT